MRKVEAITDQDESVHRAKKIENSLVSPSFMASTLRRSVQRCIFVHQATHMAITSLQTDIDTFCALVDNTIKQLLANKTEPELSYFNNQVPTYFKIVQPAAETLREKYSFEMDQISLKQFGELLQKRVELGLEFFHYLATQP